MGLVITLALVVGEILPSVPRYSTSKEASARDQFKLLHYIQVCDNDKSIWYPRYEYSVDTCKKNHSSSVKTVTPYDNANTRRINSRLVSASRAFRQPH